MDTRSNPYVGLRPFGRDDSFYFFGRREQAAQLLETLQGQRFLAVVGSSGCGKSSLVRAGLIPMLLGGFMASHRTRWAVATVRPGDSPIVNLAESLSGIEPHEPANAASEEGEAGVPPLADRIDERGLEAITGHLSEHLADQANLLLLVDQFEELFAFRGSEAGEASDLDPAKKHERLRRKAEAAEFVDLILRLSEQRDVPVYVVTTMRTDFLGDCDVFFGLPEAMNRGRYLVPRLGRQQLKEAIIGPARLLGGDFSPRLLDRLLSELGDRFDRLPVLQHALLRTWEMWDGSERVGPIDLRHFDAAGGLENALADDAGAALERLIEDEELGLDRDAVGRVFKRLTDTDESRRRIRSPARVSELMSAAGLTRTQVDAIVDRFREDERNFLYVSPDGRPNDPRVDISHESLIRQWPRLRAWVDEEAESRERFRELVDRAREERAVLHGVDLQAALDWRDRVQPTEEWAARYSYSVEEGYVEDDLEESDLEEGHHEESDYEIAVAYLEHSDAVAKAQVKRRRLVRNLSVIALVLATALSLVWTRSSLKAERESASARTTLSAAALSPDAAQSDADDPLLRALLLAELGREPGPVERLFGFRAGQVPDWGRAMTLAVQSLNERVPLAVLDGGSPITGVAYDSITQRIATGHEDGDVRLWDQAGHLLESWGASGSPVSALAFRSDGRWLAVGNQRGDLAIWEWDLAPLSGGDGTGPLDPGRALPISTRDALASIVSVSFGPGGVPIAAGTDGGKVVVYIPHESGRYIGLATAPISRVMSVRVDPGGSRVLAAYTDGVRLWDLTAEDRPQLVYEVSNFEGPVWHAEFSPSGDRVVAASDDGTLRVWPVDDPSAVVIGTTPRGLRELVRDSLGSRVVERRMPVLSASFLSSDVILTRQGHENSVRRWTVGPDVPLAGECLAAFGEVVTSMAYDPVRGAVLAGSQDGTAARWRFGPGSPDCPSVDAIEGAVRLRGHRGAVRASFMSDGRVVTASEDGTARIWPSTPAGAAAGVLDDHRGFVRTVELSPSGDRMLMASFDGVARIASFPSGEPLNRLEPGLTAADHESGGEQSRQSAHIPLRSASFHPDGTHALTVDDAGRAYAWTLSGDSVLAELTGDFSQSRRIMEARFDPGGSRVVATDSRGGVHVFDWRDAPNQPQALDSLGSAASLGGFSRDGTRFLAWSDRGVTWWDLADLESPASGLGGLRITAARLDPSGERAYIASVRSGERTLVEARDVRPASRFALPPLLGSVELRSEVQQIVTSRAGDRVLLVSGNTAHIWDIDDDSRALEELSGHTKVIRDAEFSPDGSRVVTVSADSTVRVWVSGGSSAVLAGHNGDIYDVTFSPDGQRVVAASEDATVRIWDLELPRLFDRIRGLTTACLTPADRVTYLGESPEDAADAYDTCEREQGRGRRPG